MTQPVLLERTEDELESELATVRAERDALIDKHTEMEMALRHELETVRAEKDLARSERDDMHLNAKTAWDVLRADALLTKKQSAITEHYAKLYKTTLAALSTLEQAAREAYDVWWADEAECSVATVDAMVALELALAKTSGER